MTRRLPKLVPATLIWGLVGLMMLPLLGLVAGVSPQHLRDALSTATTQQALWLSMWTSILATSISTVTGLPLAWHLSRRSTKTHSVLYTMMQLPIVLPPAVVGVALLETLGRASWLGQQLSHIGITLPFSAAAVVIAQIMVGAPFFVLTAAAALQSADDEMLLVARTLGATPAQAWLTVALPVAAPGLITAVGLAWARGLGEFGATLLFAGNMPGSTQTLPLAIYTSLENNMHEAQAISVLMLVLGVMLLGLTRLVQQERFSED